MKRFSYYSSLNKLSQKSVLISSSRLKIRRFRHFEIVCKTVIMLYIVTTLGCHSQVVPAEKVPPTEKESPQGISSLLPNGGGLLFLCTCS
jgi:hypothetical protein